MVDTMNGCGECIVLIEDILELHHLIEDILELHKQNSDRGGTVGVSCTAVIKPLLLDLTSRLEVTVSEEPDSRMCVAAMSTRRLYWHRQSTP